MRVRLAAWVLLAVAVVCGFAGAAHAQQVLGLSRVDPSSLGVVIGDAMVAVTFLVLAGCAVIGLVVLRGVAEMLNQALHGDGLGPAADARTAAPPSTLED